MSKKLILAVIVAAVIFGGAGYFVYRLKIEKPSVAAPEQKSIPDARNAVYMIEGKEISLASGKAEKEAAPGSASKIITQYFGNEVRADLNNDGIEDAAFLLIQDNGGSGTFYYVAAILSAGKAYKGTNAILLGDRIAPQTTEFKNGQIIVNYADRKPGEPMTAAPHTGISRYFWIKNGILEEILIK